MLGQLYLLQFPLNIDGEQTKNKTLIKEFNCKKVKLDKGGLVFIKNRIMRLVDKNVFLILSRKKQQKNYGARERESCNGSN